MAELSESEDEGSAQVAPAAERIRSVPLVRLLQKRAVIARPLGRFLPRSLHGSFAVRSTASSDSQVFNLEWTPYGSRVIAALENGGVRFWDPLSPRVTNCISRAHTNCVNIVRMDGEHNFWTGSDDTTIKQWDLRRLDAPTKHFHGHTNWVKTIDLMNDGQILTAAYDGTVRVWHKNNVYPEAGAPDNVIFSQEHLSRARFHNNTLALAVWTSVIIVHDFDLDTAAAILRHLDVHALFKSKPRDRAHLPPAALGDFNRVEVLRDDVHGGGAGLSLQFSACGRYLLHRRKENSNEASLIYDLATNSSIEDALIEAQELPTAQFGGKRLPARLMSQLWPSRVLYHVSDSGAGRGFIKEPSISRCGQMIASPYYKGFRIFDLGGSIASDSPELLIHPPLLNTHLQPVLTCSFHPFSAMLAAGGLDGEVKFFAPTL